MPTIRWFLSTFEPLKLKNCFPFVPVLIKRRTVKSIPQAKLPDYLGNPPDKSGSLGLKHARQPVTDPV